MPREALRENLTRLHTELESVENLDEELHTLLRRVANDIEKVLGEEEPAEEPHPRRAQLDEIALKFEADHPRLASVLGELADTLAKLGI